MNWELLIATFTAVWGINQWRREMLGRKKAEIAERALILSSKAVDIIAWARSPLGFSGEGKTRPIKSPETETNRDSKKDLLFAKVERLKEQSDTFIELQEHRYLFNAYFGNSYDKDFQEILYSQRHIIYAVRKLIEDEVLQEAFNKKLQDVIYENNSESDEIKMANKTALDNILNACRPYLEERYFWRNLFCFAKNK